MKETKPQHESFFRLSTAPKENRDKYMEFYNDVLKKGLLGFKHKDPTEKPNVMGLYFDKDYLKTIDKNVALLPIEIMSNYRDADCELMVQRKSLGILDFWYCVDKNWKEINATSIGNIAYIILNYKDKMVVSSAISLLNKIFVKQKGITLQQLNDLT